MQSSAPLAAPGTMRISEVADELGVSTHTLRYYERSGLIEPVDRAQSGHRRFTDEDLEWIEFLTHLRAAGLPIRKLQEYADLRRVGADTRDRRIALMEEHRDAVIRRLRALERSLTLINRKIASAKHQPWPQAERLHPPSSRDPHEADEADRGQSASVIRLSS